MANNNAVNPNSTYELNGYINLINSIHNNSVYSNVPLPSAFLPLAMNNSTVEPPHVITNRGFYEESAPLQRTSTRYEVTRCLYSGQTDSADTVVIDNPDYGRMLFLDHELQSSAYDEHIYHETLVHPIMMTTAHISDKRVLVVGGAEGATVREVLRWAPNRVAHIDWVDIDPTLVEVCKEHLCYATNDVYEDRAVKYWSKDIMEFLPSVVNKYDVIILDLPDPDPEQGVLYGATFWGLVRGALKEGGAIVSHAGPIEPQRHQGLDIVRGGAGLGLGTAYHTLIPSFQGEWAFWMSCSPHRQDLFLPSSCAIMNDDYLGTIMHWDRHWF
jgi:spermidine synthase